MNWVRTAAGGCLAQRGFGPARSDVLVVVLHGDGAGRVSYHRITARQVVERLPGVAAVALVRPGYQDGEGRPSDGDRATRGPANVALLAEGIAALRARTGARRVVAIGHSGGASAIVGLLERHPGTLDGAVLLACSCGGAARRVAQVRGNPTVVAYTGANDTGSPPALAAAYVDALRARGISARFTAVPAAEHNTVVEAIWQTDLAGVLAGMLR
ncbi:hypothetical protein [Muricoccus radiodurans]|uniref:hypothetical protein n=1 Tax=Muricoccus radiodurans TaxID=2231721 RepID=UPI003CFAC205